MPVDLWKQGMIVFSYACHLEFQKDALPNASRRACLCFVPPFKEGWYKAGVDRLFWKKKCRWHSLSDSPGADDKALGDVLV